MEDMCGWPCPLSVGHRSTPSLSPPLLLTLPGPALCFCTARLTVIAHRCDPPMPQLVCSWPRNHARCSVRPFTAADTIQANFTSAGAKYVSKKVARLCADVARCSLQKLLRSCPSGAFQNVPVRVQGPVRGHTQPLSECESVKRLVVFTGGAGGAAVLPFLKRLAVQRQRQSCFDGVHPPPASQNTTCTG